MLHAACFPCLLTCICYCEVDNMTLACLAAPAGSTEHVHSSFQCMQVWLRHARLATNLPCLAPFPEGSDIMQVVCTAMLASLHSQPFGLATEAKHLKYCLNPGGKASKRSTYSLFSQTCCKQLYLPLRVTVSCWTHISQVASSAVPLLSLVAPWWLLVAEQHGPRSCASLTSAIATARRT